MNPNILNTTKSVLDNTKVKSFVNKNILPTKDDVNYLLNPSDPLGGSKYELSDLENKALDPEWAKAHPDLAAMNYPGFSDSAKARRYNEGPGSMFRNFVYPYVLQPVGKGLEFTSRFGPLGSAAAAGGAGYLGGKLIDSLLNKAGIDSRFDILLSLLGTGGGYMAGRANQKSATTLSMKKNSPFYKYGQAIGYASHEVPVSVGASLTSKEETLKNVLTPGYGVFQKAVCKLASDMYFFTDKTDRLEYHVFNKLASAKRWSDLLDPYVDSVYETLTHLSNQAQPNLSSVVKSASSVLNLITGLAARGASASPEMINSLLTLSAVTGGSIGAAAWLANRHAREDVTKNEELKQKINYYNMITDELSNQLKAKGLIVSEEDPEVKQKQLV